jgi:hypothetical protein
MISGEKHYRPDELAELWGFSPKTIRALFGEEPGVIRMGTAKYVSLRIPASVAARVHERLAQPVVQVKIAAKAPVKVVKLKELFAEKGRH